MFAWPSLISRRGIQNLNLVQVQDLTIPWKLWNLNKQRFCLEKGRQQSFLNFQMESTIWIAKGSGNMENPN